MLKIRPFRRYCGYQITSGSGQMNWIQNTTSSKLAIILGQTIVFKFKERIYLHTIY